MDELEALKSEVRRLRAIIEGRKFPVYGASAYCGDWYYGKGVAKEEKRTKDPKDISDLSNLNNPLSPYDQVTSKMFRE